MRRRTLTYCLVALGLALAPAAGADRETSFLDVPFSAIGHELTAAIALGADGRTVSVWSTVTKPGPLRGAENVQGRWRSFTRVVQGQVRGVAVVDDPQAGATVAWADDGGLELAPASADGL